MLARRWFVFGIVAVGSASFAAQAQAEDPPTGNASLQETLVFGLRPRTPTDEAFITMVVAKTEAKVLPLELVIATYRYAAGKRPYPFPYFERALRVRARQIGVEL